MKWEISSIHIYIYLHIYKYNNFFTLILPSLFTIPNDKFGV